MDTVVSGRKPVLELLENKAGQVEQLLLRQGLKGQDIAAMIEACRVQGVRYRFLPPEALERAAPGCRQGVAALVKGGAAFVDLDDLILAAKKAPLPVILALDQVQDPGNVGVLARTLLALGGGGLIVPRHNAARLGGAASRASAGALERLPVRQCVNLSRDLEVLEEAGFTVAKAEAGPEGRDAFRASFSFPLVLVLGGEEKGVRPGVAKRCRDSLFIPMPGGFESLNVAQAGAIVLGMMARQARAASSRA